ncbi:MAG TPA: hypothetical protein VFN10_22365 [Thermoanaerobaculia bacterium]|nr:hypothetical protein [Thermoanaerobaculia bacterium]
MTFRSWWRESLAAIAVLVSRLVTLPRTPWEHDEFLFIQAVRDFNPAQFRPHPPGYPLYVLLAKLFNLAIHNPFVSLITVSVIACVAGVIALSRAFRNLTGDADLAVCGALLFYFSAGMLVHSPLALADATAIAFIAATFWALSAMPANVTAALAGACAAAAIGCRPQLAIPVLPALLVALFAIRYTNRQRLIGVIAFIAVCFLWFIPLLVASGGWDAFVECQFRQASYFATHDAAQSRGAANLPHIAMRFLFHPWGSKLISLPLFACVAIGTLPLFRKRHRALLPLIVFCALHLAFAIAAMDPADAVRYALPGLLLFALMAASALRMAGRAMPWIGTIAFASLSLWYCWPILGERRVNPSPAVAAIEYAEREMPPNTIVLAQTGLVPAVETLLPRRVWRGMNGGMIRAGSQPRIPAILLFDGETHDPDAITFAWRDSDAYRKLTRNVLRTVTLDVLRAEERYVPLKGMFAVESAEGQTWRWMERDAVLQVPAIGRNSVTIDLQLSPTTPYATNDVQLLIDGKVATILRARRDAPVRATLPVKPNAPTNITLHAAQSFRPDDVLHNRDRRVLAVELVGLEQH